MNQTKIYRDPGPNDSGNGSSSGSDTAVANADTRDSQPQGNATPDSAGDSSNPAIASSSNADQSPGNSTNGASADASPTTASTDTNNNGTTQASSGSSGTDADGRRLLDSGSWNGATTKSYQGGQGMHYQLKNVNVLGTTITINSNLGGNKSLLILPQQTADMQFDCFGTEPMGWTFDISTDSDAFIVAWSLYSTWIPGDPPNQ